MLISSWCRNTIMPAGTKFPIKMKYIEPIFKKETSNFDRFYEIAILISAFANKYDPNKEIKESKEDKIWKFFRTEKN
uniref:Uncharacterized protein n=1 Tax=Romanomermis culicivorax TaxID=13658 RepID=A0A915ICE8_ROMCU